MLTSAVGPADVSVDQVNIDHLLVNRVSGSANQWVPLVNLTLDTYRWDPRVRVKNEKKKKGKGGCALGLKEELGPLGGPTWLGSRSGVGSGNGS